MVWGGRRLEEDLGKVLPTNDLYGESWEISDHSLHRSIVTAGPAKGQTLRQLMETEREPLLGAAAARHPVFPWLLKFLDARDWLSVQVHPDDEAARKLWPGEAGKTEAWFVLDAEPGSKIYAGLLPGVDEAGLRQALAAGTIVECLHAIEPRPGDCLFLPAGTVHAVGGGVLLAEVQQTSDATFRLFDWDRRDSEGKSRKLHVEEALASIDWQRGPVRPVRMPGVTCRPDPELLCLVCTLPD
jgi:mannose-6-phosphate isomerase